MNKIHVSFHPSIPVVTEISNTSDAVPNVPEQRAVLKLKVDDTSHFDKLEATAKKVINEINIEDLTFRMESLPIKQELIFTFIFIGGTTYTPHSLNGYKRLIVQRAVQAVVEQLDAVLESY